MLFLKNGDINEISHINKKIIIYGAGNNFLNLLKFGENTELFDKIDFIIDKQKNNQNYKYLNYEWKIKSLEFLFRENIAHTHILIITIECYKELLISLNSMTEIDGMECYLWYGFLSVHTGKMYKEHIKIIRENTEKIPKVIHYCWFGRNELGIKEKKCLESWRKSNPDFEFCEWNEDNFDIHCNKYIEEAYSKGKYGFVSDYARYKIIAENGGFYFDLDVEIFESLNDLCYSKGFISFESLNLINSGSGIAAEINNPYICELRDAYNEISFIKEDGRYDETPCSVRETAYFRKKGVKVDDTFQELDGFLIFPHEVFAPVNQFSGAYELSENTRGIHHFACSWFEPELKLDWEKRKESVGMVNEILLKQWLVKKKEV